MLTREALDFVVRLEQEFGPRRAELLVLRAERQMASLARKHDYGVGIGMTFLKFFHVFDRQVHNLSSWRHAKQHP